MEIDNDLLDRGVAKERMAMFKNLESGTNGHAADGKMRVDVSRSLIPPAGWLYLSTNLEILLR